MNILIIDIGNSKTKCYVFGVASRKYTERCQLLYEDSRPTPRKHPWDLSDIVRGLIFRALKEVPAELGMVTAYGDAFVHRKCEKGELREIPYFVQADEPAPDVMAHGYHINGFPRDGQLTGIRALKAKHEAIWQDMHSINGWILYELSERNFDNRWDITQASISGLFNLKEQRWIHEEPGIQKHVPSSRCVGMIQGVPFLAGGLDNGFVDTVDGRPYVIAGTWLVLGNVFDGYDVSEFTDARRRVARWVISGNGKYHAQVVRRVSNPITDLERQQVLDDLRMLGAGKDVKVFGGYGAELADTLRKIATEDFRFSTVGPSGRSDLYQHQMSALYAYNTNAVFVHNGWLGGDK